MNSDTSSSTTSVIAQVGHRPQRERQRLDVQAGAQSRTVAHADAQQAAIEHREVAQPPEGRQGRGQAGVVAEFAGAEIGQQIAVGQSAVFDAVALVERRDAAVPEHVARFVDLDLQLDHQRHPALERLDRLGREVEGDACIEQVDLLDQAGARLENPEARIRRLTLCKH
jgi:hypothetical protein